MPGARWRGGPIQESGLARCDQIGSHRMFSPSSWIRTDECPTNVARIFPSSTRSGGVAPGGASIHLRQDEGLRVSIHLSTLPPPCIGAPSRGLKKCSPSKWSELGPLKSGISGWVALFLRGGAGFRNCGRSGRRAGNASGRPSSDRSASADHVLNVAAKENVRVHGFKRRGFVEALAQIRRNGNLRGLQVVVELRNFRGADDGGGNAGLSDHPIQRDLRGRLVDLFRDSHQSIADFPIAFAELVERWVAGSFGGFQPPNTLAGISFARVFSREETAGERTPGTQGNSQLLRGGNVFALDISFDQRIFQLQRDQALLAFFFSERLRTGDVPRGRV